MNMDVQIFNKLEELAIVIDMESTEIVLANNRLFASFQTEESLNMLIAQLLKDCEKDETIIHVRNAFFRFRLCVQSDRNRKELVAFGINIDQSDKGLNKLEDDSIASKSYMLFEKIMQIKDGTVSRIMDGGHTKTASNLDALTGLPNKHYFIELSDEIIHNESIQDEFVIVYFNIDKFQTFNDTYGFEVGDEFLKSVVKVLMEEIEYYLEARYSDDHFVVLTSRMGLLDKIKRIHERVHSFQKDIVMEIKAGIYEMDQDTRVSNACDWAKLACDSIKYNHNEDYRFYDASMRDQLIKEKYIIDHIDEAVEKQYLKVYYQPVVRVLSGNVCGLESLVRWIDPQKGFLSPGEFIPVLEKHRLISKVDKFVIEQVCKDFATNREKGYILVPVSINLSRLDFQLMDVCKEVNEIVYKYQIDKNLFHLEVTESALNDDAENLYKVIERLKNEGYEVWLDDFGSDYSSLNTLQNFQFDVLKIDMKFFDTFQTNESSKTIILSIIDMAKRLKMRTVAEGVETKEQFEFLKEIGCDIAQGYYFFKPNPLEELKHQINIVEKPDERSYFDDLGKINLLSPEPVEKNKDNLEMFFVAPAAIVQMKEGHISYLFHNTRYTERLKKLGIESIEEADRMINSNESDLYPKLIEVMERCGRYQRVENLEYFYCGQQCGMNIKEIASSQKAKAFLITMVKMDSPDGIRLMASDRAMLNAALESAGAMVWKYDIRHKMLSDTGTLGETYHLPKVVENIPEALIAADYVHSDSVEDFREFYRQVDLGEKVSQNFRLKSKDGSRYVWDRIVYTPVKNEQGRTLEIIGTSIDITEQKEREQNYEEQLRLNKLSSQNTLASMFLNLSQNKIMEIERNKSVFPFELKEGTSADELLKIIYQYVQGKEEKKVLLSFTTCSSMISLFEEGRTHFAVRHRMSKSEGWFESIFDFIMNPFTGEIEAMVTLKDVSHEVLQKQVMEKMLKMDYESLVIVNAVSGESVPFLQTEKNQVLRKQQKSKDPVTGVASFLRKNCIDKDVERIVKETSLPYVLERLEQVPMHTVSYTLKVNARKHVHKRAIYLYLDDEKTHILCMLQDLTDTFDAEELKNEKLTEALLLAERANQAKTEFLSRMSHDMRTPMNGILGLAALSADEKDIDVFRENMQKIRESGDYLLGLINDTLDFQRIETGYIEFHPQVVKAGTLARNMEEMVGQSAKKKNIKFNIIRSNIDEKVYVRVDLLRINQIFMNLLSNAMKFTPEYGTIELEQQCTGREGNISHNVFYVRDTGIGMSKKFLTNDIFKPFSQEYNDMSMTYAGTGLGLSIVKKLVDLMGGTIQVESKANKGTTFVVSLDFEIVNGGHEKKPQNDHNKMLDELQKALNHKRILLVEDHPLNTEIARKLLERMHCKVEHAENGKEAVEMFEKERSGAYDAILMDIRMPVMGGLDATRTIRAMDHPDGKKIPIIAMTANAYAEDIRSSLEAGMNAHLAKPIDPYLLYQTLVDLIHS